MEPLSHNRAAQEFSCETASALVTTVLMGGYELSVSDKRENLVSAGKGVCRLSQQAVRKEKIRLSELSVVILRAHPYLSQNLTNDECGVRSRVKVKALLLMP